MSCTVHSCISKRQESVKFYHVICNHLCHKMFVRLASRSVSLHEHPLVQQSHRHQLWCTIYLLSFAKYLPMEKTCLNETMNRKSASKAHIPPKATTLPLEIPQSVFWVWVSRPALSFCPCSTRRTAGYVGSKASRLWPPCTRSSLLAS